MLVFWPDLKSIVWQDLNLFHLVWCYHDIYWIVNVSSVITFDWVFILFIYSFLVLDFCFLTSEICVLARRPLSHRSIID
jgi:hypothetical protein